MTAVRYMTHMTPPTFAAQLEHSTSVVLPESSPARLTTASQTPDLSQPTTFCPLLRLRPPLPATTDAQKGAPHHFQRHTASTCLALAPFGHARGSCNQDCNAGTQTIGTITTG